MLVLKRKSGERIVVPCCELTITVLAVQGNAVQLGVSAPENIEIHREEIWLRLNDQEACLPAKG